MLFPRWIYRFRTYLACPPLIFALIWQQNETETEGLIWLTGLGIFLLGVGLRIWAQQHLHHRLRVHKQLTTKGPYQFVRNPLYISNIMICASATIISELLWLVPVTLLWCILTYSIVIRYEEARLLNKYGDEYHRYLLEVPRWFPIMASLEKLELINKHLYQAVLVELPCLLLLLPFVIKEIVS